MKLSTLGTTSSSFRILTVVSLSIVFFGCGQVFSPYMMLPEKPLRAGDVQIVGSASALPEFDFYNSVGGFTGLVRYGVTDKFSIQGDGWTDNIRDFSGSGVSLEAVQLLNDDTHNWRFALIPRVAVLTSGIRLEGWGASASLAVWTPPVIGVHPYLGAGGLIGAADVRNQFFDNYYFGSGLIANGGFTFGVFDNLTCNFELACPVIWDQYSNTYTAWLTPSIALGYTF